LSKSKVVVLISFHEFIVSWWGCHQYVSSPDPSSWELSNLFKYCTSFGNFWPHSIHPPIFRRWLYFFNRN